MVNVLPEVRQSAVTLFSSEAYDEPGGQSDKGMKSMLPF